MMSQSGHWLDDNDSLGKLVRARLRAEGTRMSGRQSGSSSPRGVSPPSRSVGVLAEDAPQVNRGGSKRMIVYDDKFLAQER